MITKLFPVLVASPVSVDVDGAPISYESYGFSPRQVTSVYGLGQQRGAAITSSLESLAGDAQAVSEPRCLR